MAKLFQHIILGHVHIQEHFFQEDSVLLQQQKQQRGCALGQLGQEQEQEHWQVQQEGHETQGNLQLGMTQQSLQPQQCDLGHNQQRHFGNVQMVDCGRQVVVHGFHSQHLCAQPLLQQ